MGTFCLYLPFFSVFGLFLRQKLFQYWADPDVFRNHNPKFSGEPEYPEESFFRQKKSPKKVERSSTPLFFGIFFVGHSRTHAQRYFFSDVRKISKKKILASIQEVASAGSAGVFHDHDATLHKHN